MARSDDTFQAVLDYYRLQEGDLTGPARLDRDVAEARRVAAYLLYMDHNMRAEAVAERVGYSSRYSVYHAKEEVANQFYSRSALSQEDRPLVLRQVIEYIRHGDPSPLDAPRQRKKRRDRRLAPKGRSKV